MFSSVSVQFKVFSEKKNAIEAAVGCKTTTTDPNQASTIHAAVIYMV